VFVGRVLMCCGSNFIFKEKPNEFVAWKIKMRVKDKSVFRNYYSLLF